MGVFDFLKERPLKPGDDEMVRRAMLPLNQDGQYVLHRRMNQDGSLRGVRLVDTKDRHTGNQTSQWGHTEAVVRLLRAAGFEAREIPETQSAWGDIEINQRLQVVSAVSGREVGRSFEALLAAGLAEGSVIRFRASLSSLFSWCVREKLILTNVVEVPTPGLLVRRSQPEGGAVKIWWVWRGSM